MPVPGVVGRAEHLRRAGCMQSNDVVLLVVAGGLGERGGIGRQISHLLGAWARNPAAPQAITLDPRGGGPVWWTLLFLPCALWLMAWHRLTRRIRLIHVNVSSHASLARKAVVVLWSKLLRIPLVLHLHGSDFIPFVDDLPAPLRRAVATMFRAADRVIILGEPWRRYLAEALHVAPERLALLYTATPRPERRHRPMDAGPCRLLFLGEIGERKGVPELLAALARPELRALHWQLTLAGAGEVERFRRQAEEFGIGARTKFVGWLPPPAVATALDRTSCLVLPSHREGLPSAILEALARGLPIVSTSVGAIAEIVADEVSGLLVPAGDVAALASALQRVITDFPLRCRLAAGSAQGFGDQFEIENYAHSMLAIYDGAIAAHAGGR